MRSSQLALVKDWDATNTKDSSQTGMPKICDRSSKVVGFDSHTNLLHPSNFAAPFYNGPIFIILRIAV